MACPLSAYFFTKKRQIMKNVILTAILLGLFGFVFSGCETPMTESPENLEVELRSAQTTTQRFQIPIQGLPLNSPFCGFGPVVGLSGYINGIIHITENANRYHLTVHYNAQNARLRDLNTGDIYVSNFNRQESTFEVDAFPYTHSMIVRSQLATRGEGNVLIAKITVKMVFNAQGEAVVEIAGVECDS